MSEAFLHYLWQFQYFDRKDLLTTAGEELNIFKPGILNLDAGPDFSQSKIKINDIQWVGCVEIHIQSSGWIDHKHQHDAAYENVILHVVWQEDKPVYRADGTRIPTLELKDRVDNDLLNRYKKLINNPSSVPCEKSFPLVDQVVKASMIDKVLMKRLERKASEIDQWLNQNQGDWEETTYQLLASNFGFKVNSQPFLQLAKSLPYKIIQKHSNQLLQIESLLFGQAGFLVTKTKDEYVTKLFTEYRFLSKKYSLDQILLTHAQWKFLRLRPVNFPSLRIAQFASLLYNRKNIFSELIDAQRFEDLKNYFQIQPSEYWHTHYRFGKKAKDQIQGLGEASSYLIIINTVVPLLVAYGRSKDDWSLVDRAVNFLQQIPAEKNKIINGWRGLGYICKTAADTQGLLELYHNFCERRQCLNCAIGASLLKPA